LKGPPVLNGRRTPVKHDLREEGIDRPRRA